MLDAINFNAKYSVRGQLCACDYTLFRSKALHLVIPPFFLQNPLLYLLNVRIFCIFLANISTTLVNVHTFASLQTRNYILSSWVKRVILWSMKFHQFCFSFLYLLGDVRFLLMLLLRSCRYINFYDCYELWAFSLVIGWNFLVFDDIFASVFTNLCWGFRV